MSAKRRYQEPPIPPTSQDGTKAAGIRGAHYGSGGQLIGGYNENGTAFGTKNRTGSRGRSIQQAPQTISSGQTKAATGVLLNQRQALFASMEKAGANGLTEDMRKQARALQVTDEGFNQAAARIKTNFAATQPVTVAGNTATAGVTVPPVPAGLNATPAYGPSGTEPAAAGVVQRPGRPAEPEPVSKIGGLDARDAIMIAAQRNKEVMAGGVIKPNEILDSPALNSTGQPQQVDSTGTAAGDGTATAVTPAIPADTTALDPKKKRSWQDSPTMV